MSKTKKEQKQDNNNNSKRIIAYIILTIFIASALAQATWYDPSYTYRRELLNTTDDVSILRATPADINNDSANEWWYLMRTHLYYNSTTVFLNANDTTEKCVFQTKTKDVNCFNPPEGLVGYWPLDDNSGDAWDPVNGNTGVLSGGVTQDVAGQVNTAYEFDGVNDYVNVSDSSGLDVDSAFTVSSWVDVSERNGSVQTILSKGKYSLREYDDDYIFEVIGDNSAATWSKSGDVGNGTNDIVVYNNKLYAANIFSDDVYVYDGSTWSKSGDVCTKPDGMAVYDNKLYTVCDGSDDAYVFDGTSWSHINSSVLSNPYSLQVYNNKLYVTNGDPDNSAVYVYNDTATNNWSKSGDVGTKPQGIATYDGKLYVTNVDSDDVYVYDGSTWSKSGDVGTTPRSLAVYKNKLYATSTDTNEVYVFDGSAWSKSGDVGSKPQGMTVYDGKLYVANGNSNDTYVFDGSTWSKSGDIGEGPRGLAVYDGKLYATNVFSNDVYTYGEGASTWAAESPGFEHVVGKVNSTHVSISVDGVEQKKQAYSFNFIDTTHPLYLGKGYGSSQGGRFGGVDEQYKGGLDDVRIYNRSLSSKEIQAIYNGTRLRLAGPYLGAEETQDTNNPPTTSNPQPSDNAVNVSVDVQLNITVDDADGDTLTVRFYDADGDSQLGTTQTGITPGSTVSQTWNNLNYNTSYSWYVNVSDGNTSIETTSYTFTTMESPYQEMNTTLKYKGDYQLCIKDYQNEVTCLEKDEIYNYTSGEDYQIVLQSKDYNKSIRNAAMAIKDDFGLIDKAISIAFVLMMLGLITLFYKKLI